MLSYSNRLNYYFIRVRVYVQSVLFSPLCKKKETIPNDIC